MRLPRWSAMCSIIILGLFMWVPTVGRAQTHIVFGFKGVPAELEITERLVERFNAMQGEVEVEILDLTVAGVSWPERLTVLFAAGTAPDVMRMEYQRSYPFILQNLLMPLDDFVAHDPALNPADFFLPSIAAHTVNGVLFGIPQEAQPFTVFINESQIDQSGIPLPTFDWTMDEYMEIARRTRRVDANGVVRHYGWHLERSITRFSPFLYAFGADIFAPNDQDLAVTSPEMLDALRFYQHASMEEGVIGGDFRHGQSTLFLRGPWMVPEFRQSLTDFEWDIMPVPSGPGGRGTTLGSDAYYIARETAHPEAAWEFVKFITSVEAHTEFAASGSIVPARQEVAREYVFGGATEPPYNLQAYLIGLEIARPTPMIQRFFDVDILLTDAWTRTLAGLVDVRTGMEGILPQLRALLED